MTGHNPDAEDSLELATMALLGELGYATFNALDEICGVNSPLGRQTRNEVVLLQYLWPQLEFLNPDVPTEAIEQGIRELTSDKSIMLSVMANREIYRWLRDGLKVRVRDRRGEMKDFTLRVIDWETPGQNHFLAVRQLWIADVYGNKRPDVLLFVNGLPLVILELKAHYRKADRGFLDNLRDYKDTIPRLFWYNAFIIVSNGTDSLMGSMTAGLEHFSQWKRINSEGEVGVIALETMLRGTCAPTRLLDLVENFTLFDETRGGLKKLIAKNHQYLGVNNAVEAVRNIEENRGRLGVFWHTQGSGKSYSMVFFTQKVQRKIPGNWTFLIITDRDDLDDQIYGNFAGTGAVMELEEDARAQKGEHLRQLLREDHPYIFTLVQKFHTRDGESFPLLSERDDIIVITDEAHRTQYDTFAANLRLALPNAAFIGFTGTPLMAGEQKTRQVFGNYVSVYNFKQAIEDEATVPLWYENRIPELQLSNQDLNEGIENLLDEALLDEDTERRIEREFAREYHLITRDDRLEEIAHDMVEHYSVRGFEGRDYYSKAMVVCIDKLTAVRMYDKVQAHWGDKLKALRKQRAKTKSELEHLQLDAQIQFMETTDMAVVISKAQGEIADFDAKGLDIRPHRQRMEAEDLETAFKKPDHPFRVVFVCAMWMTGFDAPACATIYLDKPMRNHTLMQTIARANRVFETKPNGLVVDYIGVFRELQKALAIYGTSSGDDELPAQDKGVLIKQLAALIADLKRFCGGIGVNLDGISPLRGFERIRAIEDAVNAILRDEATKAHYLELAHAVYKTYKSILPDRDAGKFEAISRLAGVIVEKIRSLNPDDTDIAGLVESVEELLDESITTKYVIDKPMNEQLDLSRIDFEALAAQFKTGWKNIEAEKLKVAIGRQLRQMIRRNQTRLDFQAKFQQMIDEYNTSTDKQTIDALYNQLLVFAQALNAEEQRGISENLTEEELAIFDLIMRPQLELTPDETQTIKQTVREMLQKLKAEKLVLDWRKKQQSLADVKKVIEIELDHGLPHSIPQEVYDQKCAVVYQHIYDSYVDGSHSVYSGAA
ncbi:MAG: type I restriction endonuclease subunit R [Anaerolineae bacterium]|nr:type I restriction endonuclease subunit R [Anaerolineae bacterium]